MPAQLNRSRPFDNVYGDNADGAMTMQVQGGKVRYFGPDDMEVGGEAQEVPAPPAKPEPKRKPKPPPEPVPVNEPLQDDLGLNGDEADAQLDLERQLAANLV